MRVVIYAAKSTADPHESIARQLEQAHAEATRREWEVVGEFQDEGFSAFSGNRGPGFEAAKARAVATAAEHGSCALLAQDSDRFARGAGDAPGAADHLLELHFAMRRQNVELWTLRSGQIDIMRALLEGERSVDESRRKSTNVPAGMKASAARGRASGGPRPYGFCYSDDRNKRGELEPVPAEVAIVKRIFGEWVRDGRRLTEIARDLQAERVPTKRGGKWDSSTVAGILRNVHHIGKVPFKGDVYDGLHEAIIDPQLFEQAQTLLAARESRGRGRSTTGNHLFRKGMLRCGTCGSAYVPRTTRGHQDYYCAGRSKLGKDHCPSPGLPRAQIDTMIYRYFEKVALDVEATRAQFAGERDRQLAAVREVVARVDHTLLQAEVALARVKRDYMDGALSVEDYNEFRPQLEAERDDARAELDRLRQHEREIESWATLRDAESEALHRLADIRKAIAGDIQDADGIAAVRATLMRLFDRFVLHVDPVARTGRVEAIVRHEAIRSVEEDMATPVVRKTALLIGSPNKGSGYRGLESHHALSEALFGPIPFEDA